MFTIDKKNRRLSKNEKNQFKKDGYLTGLPVFDKSAKADLEAKRRNFEIAKRLVAQGVQTELALTQKRALLRAAETTLFELQNSPKELELSNSYARLKTIDSTILRLKEQLDFTRIRSPQRGWLEHVDVEIGEFVDENRPLAKILGLQTLKLTIPIARLFFNHEDKIKEKRISRCDLVNLF